MSASIECIVNRLVYNRSKVDNRKTTRNYLQSEITSNDRCDARWTVIIFVFLVGVRCCCFRNNSLHFAQLCFGFFGVNT